MKILNDKVYTENEQQYYLYTLRHYFTKEQIRIILENREGGKVYGSKEFLIELYAYCKNWQLQDIKPVVDALVLKLIHENFEFD